MDAEDRAQSLCLRSWRVTREVDLDIGDALTHGCCKGRLSFPGAHVAWPHLKGRANHKPLVSRVSTVPPGAGWLGVITQLGSNSVCALIQPGWCGGGEGRCCRSRLGASSLKTGRISQSAADSFPCSERQNDSQRDVGGVGEALQRGSGQLDGQCPHAVVD